MKIYISLFSSLLVVLGITHSTYSQQQVISSAGKHVTTSGAQLTWTLGQLISTSASNNAIYLGSGFHTSEEIIAVVSGLSAPEQQVHIYPNPTTDFLSIQPATGPYKGSYQLINSIGKILLEEQSVDFSNKTVIEMHSFPEGVYVLRISSGNGPLQQFKIIKQ